MNLKSVTIASEIASGIFGWIWIISLLSFIPLVLWTIFGDGEWYYPVILLAIGSFCKSLCRKYTKQSKKLSYELTGKDYASEWIELPEQEKKLAVIEAFKEVASIYHPNDDSVPYLLSVSSLVSQYEKENRFDNFVKSITQGYKETNLKKPYQIVYCWW